MNTQQVEGSNPNQEKIAQSSDNISYKVFACYHITVMLISLIIMVLLFLAIDWILSNLFVPNKDSTFEFWRGLLISGFLLALIFAILSLVLPKLVSRYMPKDKEISPNIIKNQFQLHEEWWSSYIQGISNAFITSIIIGLLFFVTLEEFEDKSQQQIWVEEIASSNDVIAQQALENLRRELSSEDFSELLNGRDLRGTNLSFTDLTDIGAISGTNLSFGQLIFTNFSNVETPKLLVSVQFNGANLLRSSFNNAQMTNVTFSGAELESADFSNVVANRDSDTNVPPILFTSANMNNILLNDTYLDYVDFQQAVLNNGIMQNSSMRYANFRLATMMQSILDGSELTGANLDLVDLTNASLEGATLDCTSLVGAILVDANLTNASLRGADLTSANLEGADLRRADLTGAVLTNANMTDTLLPISTLTSANFSGATLLNTNLEGSIMPSIIFSNETTFENVILPDSSVYSGETDIDWGIRFDTLNEPLVSDCIN